ncbi:MAG: hypothetical protein ACI9O4_001015 [Chitinophagales bacterium]
MISGFILLALAAFFWFVMAKDATEESATGFVKISKGIFGVKGYVITLKVLAVFMLFASSSEFYKYFNAN